MNYNLSSLIQRRQFLKMGAAVLLTTLSPIPSFAVKNIGRNERNSLSFFNTHTKEALRTSYRSHGRLIPNSLDRINYILRDHRTGEIKPIDVALLDLLHDIVWKIEPYAPIHIISGYRSPRTNAALRRVTSGVALNSFHMKGRAIDIRIPGCRTRVLRQMAMERKVGGVGYYAKSDFVHLDTGPIRDW